jgi:hypothetical protein
VLAKYSTLLAVYSLGAHGNSSTHGPCKGAWFSSDRHAHTCPKPRADDCRADAEPEQLSDGHTHRQPLADPYALADRCAHAKPDRQALCCADDCRADAEPEQLAHRHGHRQPLADPYTLADRDTNANPGRHALDSRPQVAREYP